MRTKVVGISSLASIEPEKRPWVHWTQGRASKIQFLAGPPKVKKLLTHSSLSSVGLISEFQLPGEWSCCVSSHQVKQKLIVLIGRETLVFIMRTHSSSVKLL